MKCHKCQQDSIKIEHGHIKCNICGLDINTNYNLELEPDDLIDLILFNSAIINAKKLGKQAMEEGKKIEDNPYSLDSDEISLNKEWEEGYNEEKKSYEYSALSFSAEKIEQQLKKEIGDLEKELIKKEYAKELLEIRNKELKEYFKLLCKKRYIFGFSYRILLEEIRKFLKV